jgi:DNA-directed RNA polymerase subunit alpha
MFLGNFASKMFAAKTKLGILRNNPTRRTSRPNATPRLKHLASLFQGRDPIMTRVPLNRAYEQSQDLKDKLEMSTAEIGLAVRTTNCLEERGVFTVNDLLHCTREDLLSISNFGEKTLEEVYKALESVGFYRRDRERAHA